MKLSLLFVLLVADVALLSAASPTVCNECVGADAASCSAKQRADQVCTSDRNSLGTTHCASAVGKYRDDYSGNVSDVFFRGCFDCASKKEACFALGGFLKADEKWTLLQCEIECCTSDNCNTQVPTLSKDAITVFTPNASGPGECYECLESEASSCDKDYSQTCATDRKSLGTTHCGSGVGKYRDRDGFTVEGFWRGCINCADRKAACAAIGGYLKDKEKWTLLQCEIECCTGRNCNTQTPTLPPTRTTGTTASGPVMCRKCFESEASSCNRHGDQNCATDIESLGTTHCGSGVGKYRDEDGKILEGFWRGCINCADKKAACATIGNYLKDQLKWTLLQCEIECCTGIMCNTQVPTLPPTGTTGEPSTAPNAVASSGVLAFSLAFGNILYHF